MVHLNIFNTIFPVNFVICQAAVCVPWSCNGTLNLILIKTIHDYLFFETLSAYLHFRFYLTLFIEFSMRYIERDEDSPNSSILTSHVSSSVKKTLSSTALPRLSTNDRNHLQYTRRFTVNFNFFTAV